MRYEEVSYDDVVHEFTSNLPHDHNQEFTLAALGTVDRLFRGNWCRIELTPINVKQHILLAHHHHPPTRISLIPSQGLNVAQATERLRDLREIYRERNSQCYDIIRSYADAPFTPIYLSTTPVPAAIKEHQFLNKKEGVLYHIDGLHRLIGWNDKGWFEHKKYGKGQPLIAYVAGKRFTLNE